MAIMQNGDVIAPGTLAADLATIPGELQRYTASRIAGVEDLGKLILMNSASANTFTIPSDATLASRGGPLRAFSPMKRFVVCQFGAGQTSFAAGSGVTLRSESSFVNISAQYLAAMALNVGPNEWLLIGRLA